MLSLSEVWKLHAPGTVHDWHFANNCVLVVGKEFTDKDMGSSMTSGLSAHRHFQAYQFYE